jgi:hypothetical protein
MAEGSLYPPPPPLWIGWRRPKGGRWREVSRGESEAAAWRGLYRAMDTGPKSGAFDSVVLPESVKP